MIEKTHNYTHSGLDENIRLGKDGILIKNIDENNGVSFKSPNNGKHVIVRGADGIREHDFITKNQLDSIFYLNDKLIILSNSTTTVEIGNWSVENSFNLEYILTFGDNEYQSGVLKILVNKSGTKVTLSHEKLFIENEISEIIFDAKVVGANVVLELTNTDLSKQYDFLYSTGSLTSFKLTTSMLEQNQLGTILISNLPDLDTGIDSNLDYFVIEDASDNFSKKKMNLTYIMDKLSGDLNVESLPEKVSAKNTDILLIEDSEDGWRKKKVLLNEFLGEFHLNAMSFNA